MNRHGRARAEEAGTKTQATAAPRDAGPRSARTGRAYPAAVPPPPPGRRQRVMLLVGSLAGFMIGLDATVVTTALPTIHADLHVSMATLGWTVSAYSLAFAALVLTGTALGDRFGRRRVFLAGLAVFTLASAACALSPGAAWLIAAHALTGGGWRCSDQWRPDAFPYLCARQGLRLDNGVRPGAGPEGMGQGGPDHE